MNAGRLRFRWPNVALDLHPDAMVVERMLSTGPHSTRLVYHYFFADLDDPANDDVVRISQVVVEDDRAIVEAVQRNLGAGVHDVGRLRPRHETGVHMFQDLVRAALARP